jgi:site-specific DNA-methyltransferase (adenine-specific)
VGHFAFPKRYTSTTGYVRYQHECAHLLVKGTPWARTDTIGDVIDWTYSGNRFHPTEKPIQVLLPLIEAFCPPAGLTLDPFAGSGSTLIAARMLGRKYLGIELSAEYYANAQHRLSQNKAALSRRRAA